MAEIALRRGQWKRCFDDVYARIVGPWQLSVVNSYSDGWRWECYCRNGKELTGTVTTKKAAQEAALAAVMAEISKFVCIKE